MSPALVGRDAELLALDRALSRAGSGEGAAVLITGEAGIGKSALLAAVGDRVAADRTLVLTGRAAEFERDVPFALLTAALEDAVATGAARLRRLEPETTRELSVVLPSLAPAPPPSADGAGAERHRLHRALRTLLEALGAGRMMVLALDDLHWADEASVEAVLALLHRPPHTAHLLALAARPGPVARRLTEAVRDHPAVERSRRRR